MLSVHSAAYLRPLAALRAPLQGARGAGAGHGADRGEVGHGAGRGGRPGLDAVGNVGVVLGPPDRELSALPEPLVDGGELRRSLVDGRRVGLLLGAGGAVEHDEVGADVVRQPVADDVERALVGGPPVALQLGGGVLVGVQAGDHVVRAADLDVRPHRLHGLVDLVVELGVALVVPAVLVVVVEALELVPHEHPAHLRVALYGGRGELREIGVVLGDRRLLQLVPVGGAVRAALHPVGRATQREHRLAAGVLHQLHALVEAAPVELAGGGLGVEGAEAHEVDVLPDRAVVGQDRLAAVAGGVRLGVVEAVLRVGDAEIRLGGLLHPSPVAVEGDRLLRHVAGRRGCRTGAPTARAGGEPHGEHGAEGGKQAETHDREPRPDQRGPVGEDYRRSAPRVAARRCGGAESLMGSLIRWPARTHAPPRSARRPRPRRAARRRPTRRPTRRACPTPPTTPLISFDPLRATTRMRQRSPGRDARHRGGEPDPAARRAEGGAQGGAARTGPGEDQRADRRARRRHQRHARPTDRHTPARDRGHHDRGRRDEAEQPAAAVRPGLGPDLAQRALQDQVAVGRSVEERLGR